LKELKLKNVANFINGYAFKPDDWESSGKPIIRIQNLTDETKPFNYTNKKVPEKYYIKNGDVLVSWSATIDVFEWNRGDALLNQHIFKVEFKQKVILKNYFRFILRDTISELSRFRHGSTMTHVTKRDFENHLIPVPDLDNQKRIGQVLTDCETLIAQRKESIALLDDLLKSTFLEMFGDPRNNEKKWDFDKVIKFADCIVPGRDKPKSFTGNIPWVTTNDLEHLGFTSESKDQIGLTETEISDVKARTVPEGSVLMTCVGDLGVVTIATQRMLVNQQLHSFQCKDNMNNLFLMFVLSFQTGYMYNRASTTTVPYLNKTNSNSIPVIKPPINQQLKFAKIVEKVEETKKLYKNHLAQLEKLYGRLSQDSFKGELDLSKVVLREEFLDQKEAAKVIKIDSNKDIENLPAIITEDNDNSDFWKDYQKPESVQITNDLTAENFANKIGVNFEHLTSFPGIKRLVIDKNQTLGAEFIADIANQLNLNVKFNFNKSVDELIKEEQDWSKVKYARIDEEDFHEEDFEPIDIDEPLKLRIEDVSSEFLADLIKERFKDHHFSMEMLIKYFDEEQEMEISYYSSDALKKKPYLHERQDLKKFIFSAITSENHSNQNPFLKLEQVFYDAQKENFGLKLSARDYKIFKEKDAYQRSGIYFKIVK
jgi:type I restriction enzyme S subunit